jgi:tyrosine-protein phosphatase YwqE
MFSFFKKKKQIVQRPCLEIDLHSHLIPAIDDGSQSMEESLDLLRGLEEIGYKKVITTPHIMLDAYKNSRDNIMSGLEDLRKAAREEGISLEIEAAAEYYLDDGFLDLLQEGNMLSFADNHLLFETSYVAKPIQLEEMIFAIGSAGYQPVMAHPERYRYIKNPEKEYGRLKELGVMFQVNLNSFAGHYGVQAKEQALFLSKQGMIDLLGSDTHHKKHVRSLAKMIVSERYSEIFEHNNILNDTLLA